MKILQELTTQLFQYIYKHVYVIMFIMASEMYFTEVIIEKKTILPLYTKTNLVLMYSCLYQ